MAKQEKKQKELTGRHVLLMVVAFFGVIFAINAYFITAAVTSFRGEDVKGSYRQGLEYNQQLETRRAESQLGWSASYNVINTETDSPRVIVALKKKSSPLANLDISGTIRHPTDTKMDKTVSFVETKSGQYEMVEPLPSGQWQLRATATDGADTFNFQHDLWTK